MALEQILAHKRVEVARRRATAPLDGVLASCRPSTRSFTAALRGRPGFVLEVKLASPSAGTIREGANLEPILDSYGRHADAVSVVTDERFFGGSLLRLREVRSRLDQPLLCKDFVVEPSQVADARLHDADAILLILAALDDMTWRACAELAERLGMEVLTEVHDGREVDRAVALGAKLIGINNRDLRTLQVDMTTTSRIAARVPADRLVVAESGFTTREEIRLQRPHADAFLVGTSLVREDDIDLAVRRLVYGRTKVCGLTRAEDAAAAYAAGATEGGLIFVTASPRRVTIEHAETIQRGAPLRWVGVFSDASPAEIGDVARRLELSAVQLHGDESAATVDQVRASVPPGCEVWKAVGVRDRLPRRAETGADRLLLDASVEGMAGGTGRTFDWSLLDRYDERHEVILAGGMHAENVETAAAFDPFAIDVSSGVESAPGTKSVDRLAAFFGARRRMRGRGDSSL